MAAPLEPTPSPPAERRRGLRGLTVNQKRAVFGPFFGLYLLLLANDWFGLGWLGPHARRATTLGLVVMLGLWWYMGPSLAELEAHAARRRTRERP